MYLRTPKRYSKKRKRRLINLRWLWLYLLTPVVLFIGAGVINQREMFQAPIDAFFQARMVEVQDRVATIQAPTPVPTESPEIYLYTANAAYERGALDEAIANYRLAIDGMPNDVGVHFQLAHLLITNDQGQAALEVAEKAINADPYNPLGWAIKGMAYEWLGEIDNALPLLYQALELDSDNAVALSFLAEAYMDSGKPFDAQELVDRALELDPTDYNVQRNYGYVAEYSGDTAAAIQAYERARQLAPTRAYIIFNLVDLYVRDGEYDTAVGLLNNVIERNPENAGAYAKQAQVLLTYLGEQGQARDIAERCISIAPENIACLTILGSLQRAEGEFNLCARTLDRAIEAGSTNALNYYYAGTCYIVIGDCNRAREILLDGMEFARTLETQSDIRDALAQCQTIVTLEPTVTPEGFGETLDEEAGVDVATPEPES